MGRVRNPALGNDLHKPSPESAVLFPKQNHGPYYSNILRLQAITKRGEGISGAI